MLYKHFTSLYIVMKGRSSPVLFEFISVPVCHGPSCPITGGRGFVSIAGSTAMRFGPILVRPYMSRYRYNIIIINLIFINFIEL